MSDVHTYSSDVAFTPAVKAIQTRKGSRDAYAHVEERGGWPRSQPPVDQNFTLNATWTFRSVVPQRAHDGLASIAEIVPKAALPTTPFGFPSGGVFVKLNISVRNSKFLTSPKYVRLMKAMSAVRYPGPRAGLREAFPIVNCGATAKADVSNQRPVVR